VAGLLNQPHGAIDRRARPRRRRSDKRHWVSVLHLPKRLNLLGGCSKLSCGLEHFGIDRIDGITDELADVVSVV
jgi:hypothetical protein